MSKDIYYVKKLTQTGGSKSMKLKQFGFKKFLTENESTSIDKVDASSGEENKTESQCIFTDRGMVICTPLRNLGSFALIHVRPGSVRHIGSCVHYERCIYIYYYTLISFTLILMKNTF